MGEPVTAPVNDDAMIERAAEAIWVAAQRRSWSSLVIIQADPSPRANALARAVAAAGSAQRGETVEGLVLTGLPLSESRPHADRLADRSRICHRIAVVDSPLESQTALLLSRAADCAVLVVERDRTRLEDIRAIMDRVGAENFIGAVMIEP